MVFAQRVVVLTNAKSKIYSLSVPKPWRIVHYKSLVMDVALSVFKIIMKNSQLFTGNEFAIAGE